MATTRQILERTHRTLKDSGIGLTLVAIVVPGELDLVRRAPERQEVIARIQLRLSKIAARIGLDLVDEVQSLTRAYKTRPESLAMKLGHWSKLGNCLIAKPLARHLAARYAELELRPDVLDCE